MKRAAVTIVEHADTPYPLFPPELWLIILRYLRVEQRFRFATVCSAWIRDDDGLILQSIERLEARMLLPIDFMSLPNLTVLSTRHWLHLGLAIEAGYMNKLEVLSLGASWNNFENDIRGFTTLSRLRSLELSNTFIGLADTLPRLTTLTRLSLSCQCGFKVTNALLHLFPLLTDLSLHSMDVERHLLEGLSGLQSLSLSECSRLYSETIAAATQLRSLRLSDSTRGEHKRRFSQLTLLTELDLRDNQTTEAAELTHLTALQVLRISPQLAPGLLRNVNFTGLTRLGLYGLDDPPDIAIGEYEAIGVALRQWTQLKRLKVSSDDDFLTTVATSISALTGLTRLSLFVSDGYGDRIPSYTMLGNLTTFGVRYSNLRGFSCELLPVTLRTLKLNYTRNWARLINPACRRFAKLVELRFGYIEEELPEEDLDVAWPELLTHTSLQRLVYCTSRENAQLSSFLQKLPLTLDIIWV